jgi:hypothetical protein
LQEPVFLHFALHLHISQAYFILILLQPVQDCFTKGFLEDDRFLEGRFLEGRFLEGDRFLEGRLTDRFLEGRLTDRFLEGRLTDRFLEGRLTDRFLDFLLTDRFLDFLLTDRFLEGRLTDRFLEGRLTDRFLEEYTLFTRSNFFLLQESIQAWFPLQLFLHFFFAKKALCALKVYVLPFTVHLIDFPPN